MKTFSLKSLSLLEVEALIRLAKTRQTQHRNGESITEYRHGKDAVDLTLCSLTREKLTEVIALMWLGRGEGGETASDWPGLLDQASGNTPDYPGEKYQLADYLEAGLCKLGYSEAERLVFE